VRFWSVDRSHGRRRRLEAPAWREIASNYPADVRRALASLLRARGPGRGSVLLWHGAPGTGKTHALRALARSWRRWCALHYVTDPEAFLAGTDYLMRVATSEHEDGKPEWRLIVLEDAGELMSASARADVGQGLSRILNLADGLLGQGQRCLLLVTTNEPIGRLHPALRRPGRCWAEIEFTPFSGREAGTWLRRRGASRRSPAGATLADVLAWGSMSPIRASHFGTGPRHLGAATSGADAWRDEGITVPPRGGTSTMPRRPTRRVGRPAGRSSSVRVTSSRMVLASNWANAAPTQRRTPPPNGIQAPGGGRVLRKRSARHLVGCS
jgi:hypothetical protein